MGSDLLPPLARTYSAGSTPVRTVPDHPAPGNGSFDSVLRRVGERLERGERLVTRLAATPRDLDAGQALALQAGIYRYAETVDRWESWWTRAVPR